MTRTDPKVLVDRWNQRHNERNPKAEKRKTNGELAKEVDYYKAHLSRANKELHDANNLINEQERTIREGIKIIKALDAERERVHRMAIELAKTVELMRANNAQERPRVRRHRRIDLGEAE